MACPRAAFSVTDGFPIPEVTLNHVIENGSLPSSAAARLAPPGPQARHGNHFRRRGTGRPHPFYRALRRPGAISFWFSCLCMARVADATIATAPHVITAYHVLWVFALIAIGTLTAPLNRQPQLPKTAENQPLVSFPFFMRLDVQTVSRSTASRRDAVTTWHRNDQETRAESDFRP